VILLDNYLGDSEGVGLLPRLKEDFPEIPVVLITADKSADVVVEAVKRGAYDFIQKPITSGGLHVKMQQALDYGAVLRRAHCDSGKYDFCGHFRGIIGESEEMKRVYRVIENVGQALVNVMICGGSGTGKELIAKAIHGVSNRCDGPMVTINMASIPNGLIESTLFGHEKGAFTGADRQHRGAIEEAAGGTLFLDEITEMPIEVQPKLLRFIQEKTFRRVGGRSDMAADVRLISATNRDPQGEVDGGRFRMDLLYRLNVVPIRLPGLCERGDDIVLLAESALLEFSHQYGKGFESISPEVLEIFRGYAWPGNVRQLRHLIEQLVVLNDGLCLEREMIPEEFIVSNTGYQSEGFVESGTVRGGGAVAGGGLSDRAGASFGGERGEQIVPMTELEKRAIESAIRICKGSVTRAAKGLGISQATIYRKIKTYGIARHAG